MANILDGIKLSKQIKQEIKDEVIQYVNQGYRRPHLLALLVGENAASVTYVNNKIKDCQAVGFKSSLVKLKNTITEEGLLKEVGKLNETDGLDGFIVQLPLPKHINQERIITAINPDKDVDGFHPVNFGKMALGIESFLPATPYGIMEMLSRYKISTEGKQVVVIGRSRIVGRPMSILLSRKGNPGDATVTLVHSKTVDIPKHTRNADIIITALGVPQFLKADMIKQGSVIIDVGITKVEDFTSEKGYYLSGDVDFPEVSPKASWITPVPGGVGPMTRAMLLKNTLFAYSKEIKKQNK
ncbi:methylenetetrahydrofolate dehydrogenase (NADP+) / methenyltetrahydrofolate cyclohydrolase [Apibacter mensalis]|uniref:Bifunctional protein FolD n=1 Tax=Apibacter mensalis TaxID=1586267 RepID=A0A0X3AQE8_9FLAO|nr:bifunctional 5,10-methylenetetrahydrofolate dehydrogenase/5,10-methenyltetrahydrofolate cyclohydrolase [Apibacter mensalis]CVK16582.1 methylenetetrahydrofolate dehydrogenase (NADP+) / methenyltetrahydrofolate cyclohydrolase [Apibacter mensalis]